MEPVLSLRTKINTFFEKWEPTEIAVGVLVSVVVFKGVKYVVFNYDEAKQNAVKMVFGVLKSVPGVSGKFKEEQTKAKELMTKELNAHMLTTQERILMIPAQGLSHEEILRRMTELRDHELHLWKTGKVSGAIYGNDDAHVDLQNKAYALFSMTNPLHPDLFPSIRKFETEVVRMTAKMLHGDDKVCGVITSGGTESIIMAVKAYRDRSPDIRQPEMIVPVTAHAAFDKAASLMKIKIVHIPIDKDGKADVNAARRAVNKNTILIVGSAPNFPHGVIDPIEELAGLAQEHGIGFHTDSCLGGFFLPWVQQYSNGKISNFDFIVPGVTSISCDTHKYGYSTKGTSVLLFRNEDIRHAMYFVVTDWPGGVYASPTIAGSRPGGLIACCWASLVAVGQETFTKKSIAIYDTVQKIKEGIKKISHVHLMFDTYSNVVAFGSNDLDIYKVSAALKQKGWNLNNLQRPNCVHICVTTQHIGRAEVFLQDLTEAVDTVSKNPTLFKDGSAAIYGLAASFPDRSTIKEIAIMFLDALLS